MTRARLPGIPARLGFLALAAALALSDPAAGLEAPGGTVADGLGIAAHFPSDDDLDQIAALGLRLVRTDLSWARTEREAGIYDFGPYLEMARAMKARGLRPMFILDYGNVLHSPMVTLTHRGIAERRAAAPATPEAIAAYSAWAVAATRAFAEFDPVWEIWNEPDQARFWPPEADPVAYARLAARTCRDMRAASARPLTIIGPGASKWIDSDFLRHVAESDAATCFDAISVHPYQVDAVRDEDAPHWGDLRRMIDAAQPGRALAIANTEWGKSQIGRVTEQQQAAYLARSLTINLAGGVETNVWYVWKDPGDAPDNDQHHFGIQRFDGSYRPVEAAMKTLVAEIGASRFRCVSYGGGLTRALFEGPAGLTMILWSQGADRTWSPPRGLTVSGAVSLTGETLNPERIPLPSRVPVYLAVDSASPSLPCAE